MKMKTFVHTNYVAIMIAVYLAVLAGLGSFVLGQIKADPSATKVEPRVTFTAPALKPFKPLYIDVGFNGKGVLPPGMLPAIIEHGGRYINVEGNEDSFFVGGYWGVGGGPDNKPTGERYIHILPDKFVSAMAGVTYGVPYVFDNRENGLDVRTTPDAQIEDTTRGQRQIAATMSKTSFPIPISFYGIPVFDPYAIEGYAIGNAAVEKYKAGKQPMTDSDWWWADQVADVVWPWEAGGKGDGPYVLGRKDAAPYAARYISYSAANARLAYGLTDAGKVNSSGGYSDAMNFFAPAVYHSEPGKSGDVFIRYIVEQAKLIDKSKPVYPIISPAFMLSNLEGKLQPIEDWRMDCRACATYAAGAIVWYGTAQVPDEYYKAAVEEFAKVRAGK